MNTFISEHIDRIEINPIMDVITKNKGKYQLPQNNNLLNVLEELKEVSTVAFNPTIGNGSSFSSEEIRKIDRIARSLSHWRKGPFKLGDLIIDSEWRSNIKWSRIQSALPQLENKTILDIGCNNAIVLSANEVKVAKHGNKNISSKCGSANVFEMLGIEQVQYFDNIFDGILNMGIIYHHAKPIEQLNHCRKALKKDGFLILESITIPGENSMALFPEDRYARMRNVWFVPTANCMKSWLHKARFKNIEIVYDELLTDEEQRVTSWSGGASLTDFLDPQDLSKTIEGYPAPRRAAVIAFK